MLTILIWTSTFSFRATAILLGKSRFDSLFGFSSGPRGAPCREIAEGKSLEDVPKTYSFSGYEDRLLYEAKRNSITEAYQRATGR